jgi:hypothetical protein
MLGREEGSQRECSRKKSKTAHTQPGSEFGSPDRGKAREGHDFSRAAFPLGLISALSRGGRRRRYNELIFDRNSPFDFVLLNLSISSSIASTGDNGFSTLRSTQIRDRSSRGISNSSLRVPER